MVNTSADDSLGGLTKSGASIAFCRYLLGQSRQISEHSFSVDERAMIPASDMEMEFSDEKDFWVETCQGKKRRAAVAESFLLIGDPGGIGWVKTLGKPVRYAGINLSAGETDMTSASPGQVDMYVSKALVTGLGGEVAEASLAGQKGYKPIWKMFGWIIIMLLLIEPIVTNRLKR